MPSSIIESYLKDPSIDAAKKQNMAAKLDSGEWKESDVESKISSKYGNKYGGNALPKPAQPQKQWYENVGDAIGGAAKSVAEAGQAGVAEFGRAVGNTVNAATQAGNEIGIMMNPSLNNLPQNIKDELKRESVLTTIGNNAQNIGNQAAENVYNVGKQSGFDRNSVSSKVGGVAGNIAAQVPEMILGGKLTNGVTSVLPKSFKVMHPFLSEMTGVAAASPILTAGNTATNTGKLPTIQDIGNGMATDLLTGAAGYGLKKLGGALFRTSVNPDLDNPKKIQPAAEFASENGVVGGRNKIIAKTEKELSIRGEELSNIVNKDKSIFNRGELVNDVYQKASDLENLGLSDDADQLTKIADNFRKSGKETLTAGEMLDLKRTIRDKILSPVKKAAKAGISVIDAASSAKQEVYADILSKTDDALNAISPRVKILNTEMNYLYGVKDAAVNGLKRPFSVNVLNPIQMAQNMPSVVTRAANTVSQLGKSISSPVAKSVIKNEVLRNREYKKPISAETWKQLGNLASKRTKELIPKLIPFSGK